MATGYHIRATLAACVCLLLLGVQPAQAEPHGACAMRHAGVFPDAGSRLLRALDACDAPCLAAAAGARPECYLDGILALENFVQGCILLAYYLQDPADAVTLIVAGLTFSVALSRYFDYLECLIEE